MLHDNPYQRGVEPQKPRITDVGVLQELKNGWLGLACKVGTDEVGVARFRRQLPCICQEMGLWEAQRGQGHAQLAGLARSKAFGRAG